MDKLLQNGLDRALEQTAQDAYANLLSALVQAKPGDEAAALGRFQTGIRLAIHAYALASTAAQDIARGVSS
jgi:hypothetical protein